MRLPAPWYRTCPTLPALADSGIETLIALHAAYYSAQPARRPSAAPQQPAYDPSPASGGGGGDGQGSCDGLDSQLIARLRHQHGGWDAGR